MFWANPGYGRGVEKSRNGIFCNNLVKHFELSEEDAPNEMDSEIDRPIWIEII